uniref:Uncharacterized protein n=1 Tax=Amphimedon queenslandica TaxID=400682 RepID=A0A1X7UC71_AMPQE
MSHSSQFTVILRFKVQYQLHCTKEKHWSQAFGYNWCTHLQQCEEKRRSGAQQAKHKNFSCYFLSSKPKSTEATPLCQSPLSPSPELLSPPVLSPTTPLHQDHQLEGYMLLHTDTQSTCIATTTLTTMPLVDSLATITFRHESQVFPKAPCSV